LNPLLNPLLAQNMGRWAEVYFTSAPDRREEAILNLLRELEAENPAAGNAAEVPTVASRDDRQPVPRKLAPIDLQAAEPVPDVALPMRFTEAQAAGLHCPSCGHDNPPDHLFCGGCGVRLGDLNESEIESEIIARTDEDSFRSGLGGKEPVLDVVEPEVAGPDVVEPNLAELNLAEDERFSALQDPFAEGRESNAVETLRLDPVGGFTETGTVSAAPERPSRSYRVFLGTVIVVVILTLAYMAWRSAKASRGILSHLPAIQEASQGTAPPPESEQSLNNPTKTADSKPAPPQGNGGAVSSSTNAAGAISDGEKRTELGEPAKKTPDSSTLDTAQTPAAGLGNEELATARRLLSSNGGTPRNSSQAAQWLWKSIAKQNGEAALLLADLYLKGDGVSKNCDQARLLLDLAARKSVSGAGERLKNLKAYGCQ
jgi:hypothetical protein